MKTRSAVLLLCIMTGLPIGLMAQNPEWKVYTNGNIITSLAEEGNFLWVGTTGGLVKLDKSSGEPTFFNNANSGLPSNYVRDIAVGSSGDKWILTQYPSLLSRFDNTEWFTFDTSSTTIPGQEVEAIAVDDSDNVWAAYFDWSYYQHGLAKFDGNSWTEYRVPSSLGYVEDMTCLAFDKKGNVWIGTRSGLLKFDGTNWQLFNESNSGLRENDITCLAIDGGGTIWIGSGNTSWGDRGTFLTKFDSTNWLSFSPPFSDSTIHAINCIEIDKVGNKWIGTYDGLMKWDGTGWTVYNTSNSGIPYEGVGALLCDHDGNVWVGTGGNVEFLRNNVMGKGLAKFDGNTWTKFNTSNSGLPYNAVACMAIDSSGTKWIGANSALRGDWIAYRNAFVEFTGSKWIELRNSSAFSLFVCYNAIAIDNVGNKWIAGDENGVIKYDGVKCTVFAPGDSGSPFSPNLLTIDRHNNVWLGGQVSMDGLFKFDGTHWTKYTNIGSGFPFTTLNALTADVAGNVWIGTENGLVKFDGAGWSVYTAANSGLPAESISNLAPDGTGNLWVTTGNHLVKYDGANWVSYEIPNFGPQNNSVRALSIDAGGVVWLATYYSGLATFDGTEWLSYTTSNSGLPNHIVNCIAFDPLGNTWIGTENGLAVFKKGGVVEAVGSTTKGSSIPDRFVLSQNYPNPFNPTTRIEFSIAKLSIVNLKIYNLLGQEVATLVNEIKRPGSYSANWDASSLPSGVYFYRLSAGSFTDTKKLILLR